MEILCNIKNNEKAMYVWSGIISKMFVKQKTKIKAGCGIMDSVSVLEKYTWHIYYLRKDV